MNAFAWFGLVCVCILLMEPIVLWVFSEDRTRRTARKVAVLLKDGRPPGCTCPPNPMHDALPSDNRHHGSTRCPVSVG